MCAPANVPSYYVNLTRSHESQHLSCCQGVAAQFDVVHWAALAEVRS